MVDPRWLWPGVTPGVPAVGVVLVPAKASVTEVMLAVAFAPVPLIRPPPTAVMIAPAFSLAVA